MKYTIVSVVILGMGMASAAMAGQEGVVRDPQDPNIGGQLNRCWGEVASQIAKLKPSDASGINGGGMGAHSRDPNGQGETFFENFPIAGKLGIGNATANENGPHHVEPGDGGLGEHAINNGTSPTGLNLSGFINPITGEFDFNASGIELTCSLDDGTLVRNDNGDLVIP